MKKRIAILGSTGSIGTSLLNIIKKKDFEIIFLSANTNYKKLLHQAKTFKVKNLIITDPISYKKAIKNKKNEIKIFDNFNIFNQIIKKKIDYVMSSISGLSGLYPTFKIIRFTKKIAIANKESIICAWPLLKNEFIKNKTKFIPVDSEHFSLWKEINGINPKEIKKIYLTASGGPLLNYNIKSFNKIKINNILNHPTWKMGKKISVDSATMMNKCYEVIEAKKIFDLDYKKIAILIQPDSYIHAIVLYNNGFSKIILHDTTMEIPIFNSIYGREKYYNKTNNLDIKKLNDLKLQIVKKNRYPIINVLKIIPNKHSLFETVLTSVNDEVVNEFLKRKLSFNDISKLVIKILKNKRFNKYKVLFPKNIKEIVDLNSEIKLKISKLISENK
jgi:1-deoxy-D-xylulose-5-phosphate reductoisomerase